MVEQEQLNFRHQHPFEHSTDVRPLEQFVIEDGLKMNGSHTEKERTHFSMRDTIQVLGRIITIEYRIIAKSI